MRGGVGYRCGSDLVLPWLGCRSAAARSNSTPHLGTSICHKKIKKPNRAAGWPTHGQLGGGTVNGEGSQARTTMPLPHPSLSPEDHSEPWPSIPGQPLQLSPGLPPAPCLTPAHFPLRPLSQRTNKKTNPAVGGRGGEGEAAARGAGKLPSFPRLP